jgi:hypothetical protein
MEETKKEGHDVTFEDIVASGLIPNLQPHGDLHYIGHGWYKHVTTGIGYFFLRNEDGTIRVHETRQSKDKPPKAPRIAKPKEPRVTMCVIKCLDCQAEREIHIQDKFQVKRCVECQAKFRNHKRSEAMKTKRAERAAQKANGPA